MLRTRLLLLLAGSLLVASAALAGETGYIDCSKYPDTVQVLDKGGKTSGVVADLPCGERFTVLARGEFYSQIQTKDGKVGYIYTYLISRDTSAAPASQPSTAQAAKPASSPAPAIASDFKVISVPKAQAAPVASAPASQPAPAAPAQPVQSSISVAASASTAQPAPVAAAPSAPSTTSPAPSVAVEQPKPSAPAQTEAAPSAPAPGASAPQPAAASPAPSVQAAPVSPAPAPVVEQPKTISPAQVEPPASSPATPAPAASSSNAPAAPAAQPEPPAGVTPQPQPAPASPVVEAPQIQPSRRRARAPFPNEEPGVPMIELFAGYGFTRFGGGTGTNLNGALGSFGFNMKPWLQIVGDLSYNFVTISGTKTVLYGDHFGPRIYLRSRSAHGPIPFVEGLIGGSRVDATTAGTTTSQNGLTYKGGGGVDLNISRHLSARLVNADYYRVPFLTSSQNNYSFSAGIIFRFGGSPRY